MTATLNRLVWPMIQFDGVAAVARAGDAEMLGVDERQLRDGAEDGVEIRHRLAAPVLRDLVDELLSEPGRAARVGRGDHPALRRPERRVPARRPAVGPRPLRSAVDEEDGLVLLRRVEVRRLEQPVLNRRAVGARHRQALRLRHGDGAQPRRILVRQCLRTAAIAAIPGRFQAARSSLTWRRRRSRCLD